MNLSHKFEFDEEGIGVHSFSLPAPYPSTNPNKTIRQALLSGEKPGIFSPFAFSVRTLKRINDQVSEIQARAKP